MLLRFNMLDYNIRNEGEDAPADAPATDAPATDTPAEGGEQGGGEAGGESTS